MRLKFVLPVVAATLALSACESSTTISRSSTLPGATGAGATGGGGTAASISAGMPAMTTALMMYAFETSTDLDRAILGGTMAPAAPNAASATYTGTAAFEYGASRIVSGNLALDADFAAGTLTGDTAGFQLYDSSVELPAYMEDLSGNLSISGGQISGDALTATLSGTLSGLSGALDTSGYMNGLFVDHNGTATAYGSISGTVTDAIGISSIDGIFHTTQ